MADLSEQERQTLLVMPEEPMKPSDSVEPSSSSLQEGWRPLAADPRAAFALLSAQQQEFQAQLAVLQQLVAVQAKYTGHTALEEEVAGRILRRNKAWKQAAEELPPHASKALEEAFSLKDTVTKAEARDLGIVLGVTPGQVKDFFAVYRAHTRAWMHLMHPGSPKGCLKHAADRKDSHSKEPGAGSEELDKGSSVGGAKSGPEGHPKAQPCIKSSKDAAVRQSLDVLQAASLVQEDASRPRPAVIQAGYSGRGVAGIGQEASAEQGHQQDSKEGVKGTKDLASMVSAGQTAGMQVEGPTDSLRPRDAGSKEGLPPSFRNSGSTPDSQAQLITFPAPLKEESKLLRCEALDGVPADPYGVQLAASLSDAGQGRSEALPLEPFSAARPSCKSPLDLNAAPAPEEPLVRREELALRASSAGPSGRTAAAVLALAAPSSSPGAGKAPLRRVQPEATDAQGQLSQLVAARAGAGEAGEAIERLLRGMRREGSVAGRLRVLETLARTQKREVHARLMAQGVLPVVHRWLVEAVGEEQTSLVRALLQMLDLLPLHKAATARLAPVARTVLQLTRYFEPDVQILARRLCVKWKTGATECVLGPQQKAARMPVGRPTLHGSQPASSAKDARRQGKPPSPSPGRSSQPAHREAAAQSSSAAAALPPFFTKRASPLSVGTLGPSHPSSPGRGPAKRAGPALAAPREKQARRDKPAEVPASREAVQEGKPEVRKGGKFAELLRKGRRRDSEDGEVAQLLRGAAALQSSRGEKPLSADDILKAKAREKLIRQMQGRNGLTRLGAEADNGAASRAAKEGGQEKKATTGHVLAGSGSSYSAGTAERVQTAGQQQGAGTRVHSNGGPPQVPGREDQDGSPTGGHPQEATPPASDSSQAVQANIPSIDVATLSALAQMLQVGTAPAAPPATPPPRTASPGGLEDGEIASEPPAVPPPAPAHPPPPANTLLAQLVAEVERQKGLQRERRARKGPQAGESAEGAQSDALLRQLEQQVAALVEQARRQATVSGGGLRQGTWGTGGSESRGLDQAVARMEDRAVPWHVPEVVVLDPTWNVPAGDDSQEAPHRAAQDAAQLAAVYSHPTLIPDDPRPPAVIEANYDDALTPEITTVDAKEQHRQAALAAAGGSEEDEDPEYQAALAEAYAMEQPSAGPAPGHLSWQAPQPAYPPAHQVPQPQAPAAPPYVHAGPSSTWETSSGWQPPVPYAQPLPPPPPLGDRLPSKGWSRGPPPGASRGPPYGSGREYRQGYSSPRPAPPRPYGAHPQPGSRPSW